MLLFGEIHTGNLLKVFFGLFSGVFRSTYASSSLLCLQKLRSFSFVLFLRVGARLVGENHYMVSALLPLAVETCPVLSCFLLFCHVLSYLVSYFITYVCFAHIGIAEE